MIEHLHLDALRQAGRVAPGVDAAVRHAQRPADQVLGHLVRQPQRHVGLAPRPAGRGIGMAAAQVGEEGVLDHLDLDARVLAGHVEEDAVPELVRVAHGVRLVGHAEALLAAAAGELEGGADDALDAAPVPTAFTAATRNVYAVPFTASPPTAAAGRASTACSVHVAFAPPPAAPNGVMRAVTRTGSPCSSASSR